VDDDGRKKEDKEEMEGEQLKGNKKRKKSQKH
jgi:hypothetical protein